MDFNDFAPFAPPKSEISYSAHDWLRNILTNYAASSKDDVVRHQMTFLKTGDFSSIALSLKKKINNYSDHKGIIKVEGVRVFPIDAWCSVGYVRLKAYGDDIFCAFYISKESGDEEYLDECDDGFPAATENSTSSCASMVLFCPAFVSKFMWSLLTEDMQPIVGNSVTWVYKQGMSTRSTRLVMSKYQTVHEEFYPFLRLPLDEYIDDFMASNSAVLFLFGDPGTGKTSFIRHLIHRTKSAARLTYDEDILNSDSFFINFLVSGHENLLVVEDAENFLWDRKEGDGNKHMSRFLNSANGLVQFPKKKLIFTSNIRDTSIVDEALLRPGRCYDTVKFRALTFYEAQAASRVAGLEPLEYEKDYTLAQIFNRTEMSSQKSARRIGFIKN